ncbi:MAG TPA: hypothetical protein VKC51_05960 [Lacunisphaera sp.]|nr:hypothetical protein [Lacunisphaera sp.]
MKNPFSIAAIAAIMLSGVGAAAFAQDAVPAVGPAGGGRAGAASIPDLSGIWAHPFYPHFELPLSGPGPVTNRSRTRQVFDNDGRLRLPGTKPLLVAHPSQQVGDYTNPILKPDAAEIVKRHGELELSGEGHPTPLTECWPSGVPFIFESVSMQILQQPGKITILYGWDHEVRHVRMNRLHPAQVTPSWYGDSVGHYEGDTLVIDTVGIKSDRTVAMLDLYGTPYTNALHVVERYRLLDYDATKEALERVATKNFRLPPVTIGVDVDPNYKGKGLQLEFTVEDEGVFTTPWSATITYRRGINSQGTYKLLENVCAENPNLYYAGKDADLPTATKPDF